MKDTSAAIKLRLEVLEIPIVTAGLPSEEGCETLLTRLTSNILQEKNDINNVSSGTLAVTGSRMRQKIIDAKILSREQEGSQNLATTIQINKNPDQKDKIISFDLLSSHFSTIVAPVTIATIALSTCTASKTESESSEKCTLTVVNPQTGQQTLFDISDLDQKNNGMRSCSDDVHRGMLYSELVYPEDSSITSGVEEKEVDNSDSVLGAPLFFWRQGIEEKVTAESISKNSQIALEDRESGALKHDENIVRGNAGDDDQTITRQIRELRLRICDFDILGDVSAVERTYQEALRIDPTDIRILTNFAVFLHSKKGNIGGAESLFEQGLQTCFPGVYSSVFSSSTRGNNCTPIVVFNSNSGLLAIPTEVLSPSKVGFELPNTIDLEVIVGAHVLEDVNSNDNKTSIPNIIDDTFVIKQKDCSTPLSPKSDTISIYNPIQSHPMRASKIRQKDVAHLLLKFASFLTKSKGDNPNALIVYRRAIEMDPFEPTVLATAAHFLSHPSSGGNGEEALDLYARALRADPTSGLHALWYAKLLSKKGHMSQAEVMYHVAINNSRSSKSSTFAVIRGRNSTLVPFVAPLLPVSISLPVSVRKPLGSSSPSTSSSSPLSSSFPSFFSNPFPFPSGSSVEASAICNYAIFLYKQRKDLIKSLSLFENGLKKFETHKGLIKNYLLLLKNNPSLESISDPTLSAILQS